MTQRPRTDGDRTKARILDVALPLFAAGGYAGTSVRAVATAADVNVATLAYHFGDKDGLYDTVVQRLHQDLSGGFAGTPPAGPPDAVLTYWIRSAYAFAQQHREHLRLLLRHVLDHGSQPGIVLQRWSDPLLDRAEAVVGGLRPELTKSQRRLMVLSLMHLTVRFVLEDRAQLAAMAALTSDSVDESVVDWLVNLTMRQLGLPAGQAPQ